MKQIIEKLIELANNYHTFAMEVNLPMTHNHIRGGHQTNPEWCKKGDLINIYLADEGRTWQVEFKDVKIINYLKSVSFPYNSTEDTLEAIYNDAQDYLHDYLLPDVAKVKLAVMKEKHIEIEKLEQQLKKLKGLV